MQLVRSELLISLRRCWWINFLSDWMGGDTGRFEAWLDEPSPAWFVDWCEPPPPHRRDSQSGPPPLPANNGPTPKSTLFLFMFLLLCSAIYGFQAATSEPADYNITSSIASSAPQREVVPGKVVAGLRPNPPRSPQASRRRCVEGWAATTVACARGLHGTPVLAVRYLNTSSTSTTTGKPGGGGTNEHRLAIIMPLPPTQQHTERAVAALKTWNTEGGLVCRQPAGIADCRAGFDLIFYFSRAPQEGTIALLAEGATPISR
jgi:hypothetical protein